MPLDSYALLLGALLALILAGFFSAVEMAYVSVNRFYFELHGKQGPLGEKLVSEFLRNPVLFIGTTLTGNTLFLVIYAVLGVTALNPLLVDWLPTDWTEHESVLIGLETLILTVVFLPIADYLPKSLALIHPDRFLERLAVPLWVIYRTIAPIVRVLVGIARLIIRYVFRKRNPEIRPVFGLTDLNQYLQQLNQKASPEEEVDVDARIFNNAIEFRDVRVRDCQVPRTEITAVAVDDSIEDLRQAFQESGHSKIIVYRDTIDDVIGYCHALALFRKPDSIESIVTPLITVPQSMPAQDLLLRFLSERRNLALVVDEFGGTAGIVSIEDMVEQIFGEIQDEFDSNEDWEERQIDANTWLLSARHEIDDLNEKYGWHIPEGNYDTLGGLILATNEDLPRVGEVIELSPFTFTIVSMNGSRIDTVNVHRKVGRES
ncbi:CBS domain containing-hemolysin-like protein [Spirosoma oryzae]|uniref:CBS domain containing-hemolysin-like protein n=1 Tax=Spirosoma oryzae TaxID=1469603 RepID=A0A2T0TNB4_9BACT|nr:hemolysin family protein [Spirosoma oryzae]PRY47212.1 CBS domain containing-hemolysin-like protein [Spirosoma oryzae]